MLSPKPGPGDVHVEISEVVVKLMKSFRTLCNILDFNQVRLKKIVYGAGLLVSSAHAKFCELGV